jgi:hypothetical protein
MDIEECLALPVRTCVHHPIFGHGYVERVSPGGFGPSIVLQFIDHGLKELQLAFAGDKLKRAVRPKLHEELEVLTKNGAIHPAVLRAEFDDLAASGEEPMGYFTRRGMIQTSGIDHDALAAETIEIHPDANYKELVGSMMRAANGRADPCACLAALRRLKAI